MHSNMVHINKLLNIYKRIFMQNLNVQKFTDMHAICKKT